MAVPRRAWLSPGSARGLAALVAGSAAAAPAQVLRYGGDVNFAPFESLDSQGRPRGFQIELLAALEPVLGLKFDIRLRPWPETEADFRAGRVDVVAMVDTVARQSWASFTQGHATPALALYRQVGVPEFQGLQDLSGRRIALLDSEPMRDTQQRWLSGLGGPFLRQPDALSALRAVQQGQADVALLPRAYADPLLAAGQVRGVVTNHLNLPLQTYALAVAPGRNLLRQRLQSGLDVLESQGTLEALRTRWLSSHRDLAERERAERGLARQRSLSWGLGVGAVLTASGLAWALHRRGQRVALERGGRLAAEAALSQAQALLDRSYATNPAPMLLVERASGLVRDANAALLGLLGLPAESVIDQALAALARQLTLDTLEALVQGFDQAGSLEAMPLALRRADGQLRHCLVHAQSLRVAGADHAFCVLHDVTDRMQHDAELRAAYEALAQEAEQARAARDAARAGQARAEGQLQAFTSAVAHDLRAPLNAVQGFAGLLRKRLLGGHVQEAVAYAEQIDRASRRMDGMVSALGELARVAGRPLQRETVDMATLARDTWSLLSVAQPDRRPRFALADLPATQADPRLAGQVWQNLLDNAAKYSARSAAPAVGVDSYRDARGTWYRVTDNGVGFDMQQAGRLFQPFQRLHSNTEFEGQGVGLSLVRRIVDHHRGELRLRSSPGVGTVAEFTLDPPPEPA